MTGVVDVLNRIVRPFRLYGLKLEIGVDDGISRGCESLRAGITD